jgi:hypothetical protein
MMIKKSFCTFLPLAVLLLLALPAEAQETGKKQTIDITSSFKPVLRNAAKINFNASPPGGDSSRPKLGYTIPIQNVVPGLLPVSIKPLALDIDSTASWVKSNYLKAGFGNLSTPFVEAGLSFGEQRAKFNILASHISSNGKIEFQDYARSTVMGHFYTPISTNHELHGKFGYSQDKYYQYGYDKTLYNFSKSDLLKRYNTFTAEAGFRNFAPTEYGLSYHPDLKIDIFSDNRKNNESSAVLDLPLTKSAGGALALKVGFKADFTRYTPDNAEAINNNIITTPVALLLKTPNLKFQAGLTPSWDNGLFRLLPSFLADFPVAKEKWVIQAGWISYYNKGSYQRFASINPYMSAPTELKNTRMVERFVGFKGTLFHTFTYNAKLGYAEFNNTPLFVNDDQSGKSFNIIYEEKLKAMQIQGELGFLKGESFSLQGGFNWYSFNDQVTEDRAWGMVPLEIKARLRWMIIKDLWLKSDLFIWDGPLYKKPNGSGDRLPGAFDLNAGLEFRITKNLMLWTQFNNITNSKYQRWNQYNIYGFNMLGGVSLSF